MPVKKRNVNIDLLKIIACLSVVGLHSFNFNNSVVSACFYYFFGFAIPVFYMSSGYVLMNREKYDFSYALKKAVNVFKVVAIWNFLYFLIKFILGILNIGKDVEIMYFPKIFVKSFIQRGPFAHFWYFGTLIIMYFLIVFIKKEKIRKYVLYISIAVSLLMQICSIIFHQSVQSHITQTFRLWTAIMYISLGGFMPQIQEWTAKKIKFNVHIILTAFFSVLAVADQYYCGLYLVKNRYAEYYYDDIIIIIWSLCIFTLISRCRFSEKTTGIIEKIIPLTMGIYILHPLIIDVFGKIVNSQNLLSELLSYPAVVFISGSLTYIISKIPVIRKIIIL